MKKPAAAIAVASTWLAAVTRAFFVLSREKSEGEVVTNEVR
jgi:hypothetical protein